MLLACRLEDLVQLEEWTQLVCPLWDRMLLACRLEEWMWLAWQPEGWMLLPCRLEERVQPV